MPQAQIDQVRTKCREVFVKAKELYPHLRFDHVDVRFDLRGRAAGQAMRRGHQYAIRFNRDMLTREAFDHVLNNTVPHEIAHIVCFMDPHLGDNHNTGWARVCRALGGTGDRCHSEEVIYGKGYTYEYTTSNGKTVRMGDRHHRDVQAGHTLRYRNNLGSVTAQCDYKIVGYQGRTLEVPILRTGKPAPANIRIQITGTAQEIVDQLDISDEVVAEPVAPAAPVPVVATPVAAPITAPVQRAQPGESKAAVSRRIMLSGYRSGQTYEQIIAAMIAANGYERQLARATFKANSAKVGIPTGWGG